MSNGVAGGPFPLKGPSGRFHVGGKVLRFTRGSWSERTQGRASRNHGCQKGCAYASVKNEKPGSAGVPHQLGLSAQVGVAPVRGVPSQGAPAWPAPRAPRPRAPAPAGRSPRTRSLAPPRPRTPPAAPGPKMTGRRAKGSHAWDQRGFQGEREGHPSLFWL